MTEMLSSLIAPCGIDCGYCRAHLKVQNPCPGCRIEDAKKPKTRLICKIKTCQTLVKSHFEYCFECDRFPCPNLIHLDTRYRTKYGTSVVDNLIDIQKIGLANFIKNENKKWTCPECGARMCIHQPDCPACGYLWRR